MSMLSKFYAWLLPIKGLRIDTARFATGGPLKPEPYYLVGGGPPETFIRTFRPVEVDTAGLGGPVVEMREL